MSGTAGSFSACLPGRPLSSLPRRRRAPWAAPRRRSPGPATGALGLGFRPGWRRRRARGNLCLAFAKSIDRRTTMSTTLDIRPAAIGDAEAICRIYNQGIEDRLATLETTLRTPDERRAWLAGRGPRHPVLVAVRGGAVVGWASLNAFNPRACYDHVGDFSLYVEREQRGTGIC